ncbi:unnamed protein product [Vitrella brassicaformis CCMP3155]|uniref:Uncharacterized protein n=1 Tax=Vitrella brassicaformis (strain CCMP3155) TaxID=1169540 RepID=A0A0G4FUW4_VITBC|nr:unnamed protein product [Vitrella brassicaformis CCMP3155]|eukprot:CEM18742.1 unnamed protein product [Vitrella brassicaformis CCMP3155]
MSSSKGGQAACPQDEVVGVGLAQLESECVYEVGDFLTTIERKPLSLVCHQLHQKTTDATYGILYRDLTISILEHNYWKKINLTGTLKTRLSKIETAFIDTDGNNKDVLPSVVECIEASNATLVHIGVDDPKRGGFSNVSGNEKGAGSGGEGVEEGGKEPVVFEKTQQLHLTDAGYLDLAEDRKWAFPSLEVLSVGKVGRERISLLPAVTHIVSASPKITSITADVIVVKEGDEWQAFTSSLSGCPKLTSISGLHLVPPENDYGEPNPVEYIYDPLGRLTTALDTNWRTDDMKGVDKTIIIHHRFSFGADFSRQLTDRSGPNHFVLQDLLNWADETKCQIVWMPREDDRLDYDRDRPPQHDDIVIDCGKEAPDTTPPAPHGPVGQLIANLTKKCDAVKFVYGGAPLHDTWGQLLTFPAATKLSIYPRDDDTAVRQVVSSIPEWLVAKDQNGNSTHLPAIQDLYIDMCGYSNTGAHNNSLPTGAEAGRLEQLLGGLTGVRRVWCMAKSLRAVSQCVSYLHARELKKLRIRLGEESDALPDSSHVPVPSLAYPSVNSLRVSNKYEDISKECARSVLSLLMSIKPVKASIDLTLSTESLAGTRRRDLWGDADRARSYALWDLRLEAERRVGSAYDVVSVMCMRNSLRMELVRKEGGKGEKGKRGKRGGSKGK